MSFYVYKALFLVKFVTGKKNNNKKKLFKCSINFNNKIDCNSTDDKPSETNMPNNSKLALFKYKTLLAWTKKHLLEPKKVINNIR